LAGLFYAIRKKALQYSLYPFIFKAMINNALQTLIDDFALFDDWEDRYRYLIDMGRKLPTMDENLKTESNLVKGCTSRVWMDAQVEDDVLSFTADSDAHIVRGLIAILYQIYNGKTLNEISSTDIEDGFAQMGLDQNLSPNRRNGFFAIVERIRSLC